MTRPFEVNLESLEITYVGLRWSLLQQGSSCNDTRYILQLDKIRWFRGWRKRRWQDSHFCQKYGGRAYNPPEKRLAHSCLHITTGVDKFPFEVVETGWGEFEILIKVYVQDGTEKSISLFHHLQLYPKDDATLSTRKTVHIEHYDEIVSVASLRSSSTLKAPHTSSGIQWANGRNVRHSSS